MRYLSFLIFTVAFIVVVACAKPAADNTIASAAANAAPTATPPPASPAPSETPTPADDAPRITVEEAKKAFDEGKAFIIDARAEEAYKAEHIKGAVNIRHDNLDAMLKQIPRDKTIIVYCS
jgi:3-mercaptopyruvate sulfurtransferase SseA